MTLQGVVGVFIQYLKAVGARIMQRCQRQTFKAHPVLNCQINSINEWINAAQTLTGVVFINLRFDSTFFSMY